MAQASIDEWLATLDAVMDALPDTFEKQHAERLKMIRDILGLVMVVRQLQR
ncbi:hypothetical protein [Sporomusa acidovorans]|uniref:Uncharacterized protein n=1 Tax=Sporomusa acidovorans (strain ATCC 49682 / DSM 3132 / Mol) TaxID=1123286 RepID=A0ABZ3IY63_SPOA4|nr:hypothetical protein [Sporomusa acidovorans]OZC16946.1 hypothetical protein SPACI_39930 [Sporomusa acidovorans DSM 3132]SDE13427.1 hypothetical protein SAMN04488499_1008122 [Sporomusa acidovorans]